MNLKEVNKNRIWLIYWVKKNVLQS